MTKRDFEAIAAVVLDLWASADSVSERYMVEDTAHALADVCAESNEKFDRDRFLQACGV
jgi:hypothetical protein